MPSEYIFPTAFIGHGGGPWPIISFERFKESERDAVKTYMENIAKIPKEDPKAILIFSAHWEGPQFKINTNPNPPLLFDYFGFPDEAYKFTWPAKNDLSTVENLKTLLSSNSISFSENNERGYDHGVFIPLMLAYPEADIPVIQMSLKRNLNPAEHYELGQTLAPLRKDGVFIIGSGNSYHNLKAMFNPTTEAINDSKVFDEWLKESISLPGEQRKERLLNWEQAPQARESHPREEHFIPLLIAAGAAHNDPGCETWAGEINGTANTAFHFGS